MKGKEPKYIYGQGDEYISYRCSQCAYKNRIAEGDARVCQACGHDEDVIHEESTILETEAVHIGSLTEGGEV